MSKERDLEHEVDVVKDTSGRLIEWLIQDLGELDLNDQLTQLHSSEAEG